MQDPITPKQYFPALTGIRAIAATMVFFHHFNIFKPQIFGNAIHSFVAEFHVGVTIFFVLSGFLICYRYHHLISLKRAFLWDYFVNRAARIYPLYFLITIIYSLPLICKCDFWNNFHILLLNLTFLRGLFDEYKFTLVPSGWSLTVEEMFYFLFPLIILFSRKMHLLLQAMLFFVAGAGLSLLFRHSSFHGFMTGPRFVFEFTFFGRCFEFFTGMYLALLIRSGRLSLATPRRTFRTPIAIACIAIAIALLAINTKLSTTETSFLFFETAINNFMLPPAIAFLLYGLIRENTIVAKTLSSSPFDLLGKSSYAFYLIHNGILFSFLFLFWNVSVPLIFIILQITALFLYLLVEHPINLWLRSRLKARPDPDKVFTSSPG